MFRTLKHRNRNLVFFSSTDSGQVEDAIIYLPNSTYLPLPLKWCLSDKGLIDEIRDDFVILNEEGVYLVEKWLGSRQIPAHRYIKNGKTARQWMLDNHAYSFTDNYWVENENENLRWEDLCNSMNNLDTYFNIRDTDYKGYNSTLGGELEKFWYKDGNQLMLCKKNLPSMEILSLREVLACMIYEKQGNIPYCNYNLVYHQNGDVAGCYCRAFTDINTELITAYDLIEEYNRIMDDNIYELIIQYAAGHGLDTVKVRNYLDVQTIVDFLIGNRDRHLGNIAFLRDSSTLKLIDIALVFDSGSMKEYEGEKPENSLSTKVNSFEVTTGECLHCVTNFNLIDVNKLPSIEEVHQLLFRANKISEYRKNELLEGYEKRVGILKDIQRLQNTSSTPIEDAFPQVKAFDILDDLF